VPILSTLVFLVLPMVMSFAWSFTDYNGIKAPNFVGLQNYIDLFTHDDLFLLALRNTTIFVFLGMLIGPTLGLITALMLNQKVLFQSFFRTAYFLPVMTSLVVVSTIWIMLYSHNGLFNSFLMGIGAQRVGWLSDPKLALVSVVIASVWQGFGFETVVFLAALQSIPKEQYEAATMDGASPFQRFLFITIPFLRPVMLYVYIIGIIGSYQVFDQIYVMTAGGPVNQTNTLVYYLFTKFQDLRLGYASAVAYVLFGILVIFSFLQMRFFGGKD
jgi:ABC-type sugar transport system permease subunit